MGHKQAFLKPTHRRRVGTDPLCQALASQSVQEAREGGLDSPEVPLQADIALSASAFHRR